MERVLVTGAAGHIGGHLCKYLKDRGYFVRAVDWVAPRYGEVACDESSWTADLRRDYKAQSSVDSMDWVMALASNMGGMGFLEYHGFEMLTDNARININTALAAKEYNVEKVLFTSSACIYPEKFQMSEDVPLLTEDQGWEGRADTFYGTEKRMSEEIYLALSEETDIKIALPRFHNIFGERGSWSDGREKLPAAACRKVAEAKLAADRGEEPVVEIWGDGLASRSFCYVSDCCEMLYRLMLSDYGQPVNIGTDRAVTVDEVFDIVAKIAGVDIIKKHVPGPQGVRSRSADLSLARRVLDYEPLISLEDGLAKTYAWVYDQVLGAQ